MSLKNEIKGLCRKYQIRPRRRQGQNFLICREIIQKMIKAAELNGSEAVLEIGPGLGFLTKQIALKAQKVVAVEIDERIVSVLKNELRDFKNIEIIQGNILDLEIFHRARKSLGGKFKIISSLPFNITGAILRRLSSFQSDIESMILILQKEVGERIVAQPPQMSLLAVSVQFFSQAEIVSGVDKNNFWPQPKVDAAIIRIIPRGFAGADFLKNLPPDFEKKFFQIVRAGFFSPRKYLLNNFVKSGIIKNIKTLKSKDIGTEGQKEKMNKIFKEIGLNPRVRAQELPMEKWIELANKL